MFWDAKSRLGRESAEARVFEVVLEEAVEGWFVIVGDIGDSPTTLGRGVPFLGACCRLSCKAFARAFSCVRTKWARFCRNKLTEGFRIEISLGTYLNKELPILSIHHGK